MIIGKVVGTVICTRKNPDLIGNKFMIVDPMEKMSAHGADRIVAVDDVGAGIGDIVLVTTGSSARLGITDPNSPVDACIVGIVDDPQKIVIVE
ncbi:MAG TPA: EutN/CcmL family microcompartment protein [Candidatus Limivivens intestinipullorum]|uniref:EutN/CcmL family microcompartment protein n=1 Tax=Candidatus Limivivens intestinipullorum TaxID=2840858 RepID=A0A9D1JIJ7_9FIRM|nr:EutN/CcmL family microcompartment protein [Candidatus Limivivens intestinipullorum]